MLHGRHRRGVRSSQQFTFVAMFAFTIVACKMKAFDAELRLSLIRCQASQVRVSLRTSKIPNHAT